MKYVLDGGLDFGVGEGGGGCRGNNLLNYSKKQLPDHFSECLPGILLSVLRSSDKRHYQIIKKYKTLGCLVVCFYGACIMIFFEGSTA